MHYLPPEQLAEVRSVTLRASLTRTLHAHLLLDHMRLAEEETAVLFTCSNMLVPPLHLAALVPRLQVERSALPLALGLRITHLTQHSLLTPAQVAVVLLEPFE